MKLALEKRNKVKREVVDIDNKIRIIEKSINLIFVDTHEVNEFIRQAPEIIPRLKNIYSSLEIQVERIRLDIAYKTEK